MAYTLQQLAQDIRAALTRDPGPIGKAAVCTHVSRALNDADFVARHLGARAPGAGPREILHEDPELGFCICGHVYDGAADGSPHDHGPSWAVYGQAEGITEMTDWAIVEKGAGDAPTRVAPQRTYALRPGDAHLYDVGAVHSPRRAGPTKLVRVEGQNLDHVRRTRIRPVEAEPAPTL